MDELTLGVILYLLICTVVTVIANKRGRSWFVFGCLSFFCGIALAISLRYMGLVKGAWSAFFSPFLIFIIILSMKNEKAVAVKEGTFGNYKKCPFCAEPVRKEAIKCKHCASKLD